MKNYNKIVGKFGENVAKDFLEKNKYSVISQNYTSKFGEIDIILTKNNYLIFVEVKTRTSNQYGFPSECVNYLKQKKIIRTAREFISKFNFIKIDVRFDVLEVYVKFENDNFVLSNINHIENAFAT